MTLNESITRKPNPVEFGNGRSLKYFNFIFKVFIVWTIITTALNISNLNEIFVQGYQSNISLFFFIHANTATVITMIINLLVSLLACYFVASDNKPKFVKWFLLSILIRMAGLFIVRAAVIIQFSELSNDIVSKIDGQFIVQLLIFIPHWIYLRKRRVKVEDPHSVKQMSISIQHPELSTNSITSLDEENTTHAHDVPEITKVTEHPHNNFCSHCGKKIESSSKYCPECGTAL